MNSEDYSDLALSVLLGSIVLLLSVETLLEARLGSGEAGSARRALRRWASVGVTLFCLVALFLEFENGEGFLWLTAPILCGPILVSWLYVLRRFAHAVAFRLLPIAAFSLGSGTVLVTSVQFQTPPYGLVFVAFTAAALIWGTVTRVRSFTVPRKLGGWPPPDGDAGK